MHLFSSRTMFVAAAALAAGMFVRAAGAVATPLTLQDLINDGGITYGDKSFSDFAVTGNIDPAQINVIQAPGSNIGLEFQYNWTSTNGADQDTVIHYAVHVNNPADKIVGVGLSFDGSVTGSNSPLTSANVTETISDLSGNILGQMSVPNNGSNSNSFAVDPTSDLLLDKDIMVHSPVGESGTATISFVDNTFTQVPEPAVLGLLGIAAPAVLRRRRGA